MTRSILLGLYLACILDDTFGMQEKFLVLLGLILAILYSKTNQT